MNGPLMQQFLSEGRDLLERASEGLLELERKPDQVEFVHLVFRAVHTLKGNSGLFEVAALTELLHAAEELMVALRDGSLPLGPEVVDALLGAIDGAKTALDDLEESGALGPSTEHRGRRLARDLRAVHGAGSGKNPDGGPSLLAAPSWAHDIPAEVFASGPVCLFEYLPHGACYFRGEDPVQIAGLVPNLRWRSLRLDETRHDPSDPYACAVVLRGVSAAPVEDVLHALRYVAEEVSLHAAPAEGAAPEEAAAPTSKEAPSDEPPQKEAPVARVFRVEPAQVDRLMNLVGQLLVAKNGLPYLRRRLAAGGDLRPVVRDLDEHATAMDRIASDLQAAVLEVRMLPVSQVFQRFPRLVRDIARRLDKQIELEVVGEDTRADKNVIEALSEPLVHLVRNALDHGLETAEERLAAGKTACGTIRLSAHGTQDAVVLRIEDDGRGIDPDRIRALAVDRGLITEQEAQTLCDEDAQLLVFAPGFSTKEEVSDLSGRGVGMDVVRTTVERVGGLLTLKSKVGAGTQVTLSLPSSLVVSRVLSVQVAGNLYGVAMEEIAETVRIPSGGLGRIKDKETFWLRGRLLPVRRLRRLLGLPGTEVTNAHGEAAALILRSGMALVVDELGENLEVLVRPLDGLLVGLNTYAGSAVLGDGRLMLVLAPEELHAHV